MGAVIAGFTGSPVPEPMPVIMNEIIFIRSPRRRALPEIVIDCGRNRHFYTLSYGFSVVNIPGLAQVGFTDPASADFFHRFDQGWERPSLIAHLNEFAVTAHGLNQHFAFCRIMSARLFYIYIFTVGYPKYSRRRVPVIRRCD